MRIGGDGGDFFSGLKEGGGCTLQFLVYIQQSRNKIEVTINFVHTDRLSLWPNIAQQLRTFEKVKKCLNQI